MSTICVHNNFPAGKTCISMWSANHKFTCWVNQKLKIILKEISDSWGQVFFDFRYQYIEYIIVYLFLHGLFCSFFLCMCVFPREDKFIMLCTYYDSINPERPSVIIIFYCDLGFTVGPEVFHFLPFTAYCSKFLEKYMGEVDTQGHIIIHFTACIAKHHPLVAGSLVFRLIAYNTLSYVTRLLMDGRYHSARIAIKTVFGFCVSNISDNLSGCLLDINPSLSPDFSTAQYQACRNKSLTCDL